MKIEQGLFGPIVSDQPPLIYPGGKIRAWKTLNLHLPYDITTLVSPFIGGGAIELKCAARGIKVTAADILEPLTNFWQYFIKDSSKVMKIVHAIIPLSYEERYHYYQTELKPGTKHYNGSTLDNLNRAALFFLLNRQSFRGWTLLAPPSKTCFMDSLKDHTLKKFENWHNPNIKVLHSDYRPFFQDHLKKDDFIYADPPYVEKEHFYGTKDSVKEFDHYEFMEHMSALQNRWIISYLKHDLVIDLYKNYRIVEYQSTPTIVDNKKPPNTELFIMNF